MLSAEAEPAERDSRSVWRWGIALAGLLTGGFAIAVVIFIVGVLLVAGAIFLMYWVIGDPCGALADLFFGPVDGC